MPIFDIHNNPNVHAEILLVSSPVLDQIESVVERLWKVYLVDILGQEESRIDDPDEATEALLQELRETEELPTQLPCVLTPGTKLSRAA